MRQSFGVTPFWSQTRVMRNELVVETQHMSSASLENARPASPARSPAAGMLPPSLGVFILCVPPPIVWASPSTATPAARPPPAPNLPHNSILFTETDCPAWGRT